MTENLTEPQDLDTMLTAEDVPAPSVERERRGPIALDQHADKRTLIFPDARVFFVPVPKAGCTSVMWSLARMAGLDEEQFYGSLYREVSRSLTIHDVSVWPDEFLFSHQPDPIKDEILSSSDWFRFTTVRDPLRRLWSAWQSKILLNEPQFMEKFGSEAWLPRSVDSAEDILNAFREFLDAVKANRDLIRADVHWAPQVDLTGLGRVSYTHIGRFEKIGETLQRLREHLRSVEGPELPDLPRTNVSALPYVDGLFKAEDVEVLKDVYADDLREFGYQLPPSEVLAQPSPPSWIDAVDATIPALEDLRHRNERVGDLHRAWRIRQDELTGRIGQMRGRIDQLKKSNKEQKRRNNQLTKLRAEEHRRNERLQKRLREANAELKRIKNSSSWRYTAPLRRLGLGRLRRRASRWISKA
jgi:hypothetical protein